MDRQMNIALRKTLDQIGVKHSLKGYGYIISAVEKCLENRSKLISIIKGLYTEIAEENSDTVWRVERSIRHAIEVTWTNGNKNAINKIIKGRICFIIAHRLSTIKNCDKILLMKDGKIIEEGNHTELIERKGEYYELIHS